MSSIRLKPDILEHIAATIDLSSTTPVKQFVIQHIYPDTVRLLKILHRTLPIHTLISISYSGNKACIKELEALGIRVLSAQFDSLDALVAKELKQCIEWCQQHNEKLIIHEVGGYGVKAAHAEGFTGAKTILAALEITKQGVWVAEKIAQLKFPQFNIAQTKIKAIEGNLVGDAVVSSIDTLLREVGISLNGRTAAVAGFGWIGKGTAQSLRKHNMMVGVAETNPLLRLEASIDGFKISSQYSNASLVVGCTGTCSIDREVINQLPDGCVLASGASKNHEIELNVLSEAAHTAIHDHITACAMPDGRTLYLLNDGYPVNFTGPSVADEIVELLFAELLVLVPKVFDPAFTPGIYTLSEAEEMNIANSWLQLRELSNTPT